MARDLPYFKFIVSEWNDGDIRLCSFEAQGLFINLCALYWSSGGKLSLAKCMRRYSGCNAVAFEELQREGIIKITGDNIGISFLDEQFHERTQLSKKNAENAANGWGKRKKHATSMPNNATALPEECDPIDLACNIEKRREEKKREEEKPSIKPYNRSDYYDTPAQAFDDIKSDEMFIERVVRIMHAKGFKSSSPTQMLYALREFLTIEGAKDEFPDRERSEVKSHFTNWTSKYAQKIATDYAGRI